MTVKGSLSPMNRGSRSPESRLLLGSCLFWQVGTQIPVTYCESILL